MHKIIFGMRALLNLLNPRHWGPFAEISNLTKFDHAASVSWSQGGEDLALLHIFSNQEDGTFLDVGAHHPDRFSVTRHLYQRGWAGVNVEANPYLLPIFHKRRVRDINLNYAVGTEKSYQLNIFTESAISSVNEIWVNRFLSENNRISEKIIVPGISLRTLLDQHFNERVLDLLTIDAEGADLNVLESLGLETLSVARFPRWLLLEANPPVNVALETESVKYAMSFGYQPYFVLPMSVLLKSTHLAKEG